MKTFDVYHLAMRMYNLKEVDYVLYVFHPDGVQESVSYHRTAAEEKAWAEEHGYSDYAHDLIPYSVFNGRYKLDQFEVQLVSMPRKNSAKIVGTYDLSGKDTDNE